MSTMAELNHVSKSYGHLMALDDVTLNVRRGEVFALVGPNGSGKTTLLKVLACLERPDDGEAHICGERVDNSNRNRVRMWVTLVFQRTTFFTASVYDNIAYGLRLRKAPQDKVDQAVKRTLGMVKLEGFERRQARKLSGGEQQRVALARALALDTPLLLLDEPTANLDPRSVSIIEEVVKQVNKQKGVTVILATHNVFQARQVADKAALLVEGKVADIGSVEELIRRSQGLAGFGRLENMFSGTSEVLEEGTSWITFEDGTVIESAVRQSGRVTVFVRPEDIIISKKRLESSARNVFEGRIVEVSDLDSLVRLKVHAGKVFFVQVTKRSFAEMGLGLGEQVCLTFKASSVQLV